MRFWDSSAIVPLVVPETESGKCSRALSEDPELVVWALTPVEVLSAVHRKHRDRTLEEDIVTSALERLDALRTAWNEVGDLELVRARAERLLAVHAIRAAEAMQLAAALLASNEQPKQIGFVGLDERLNGAASREGFRILP